MGYRKPCRGSAVEEGEERDLLVRWACLEARSTEGDEWAWQVIYAGETSTRTRAFPVV